MADSLESWKPRGMNGRVSATRKLQSTQEKGANIMAKIEWITTFAEGLSKADRENRFVLLDFFNPG